ncbi:MAG: RDD family protein [Proteobacteria bacterium]|nr:RDD family protein [Pseudomonadota bacterium]MBS0548543.1 RDD family protein [Pseudomonadota bacterium]
MTDAPPPPVWDARPPTTAPRGYGGFWIRVVAYVIDGILLNIAFGVLSFVTGISLVPASFADMDSADALGGMNLLRILSLVGTWLYFALMESSKGGATVGKMVVGLKVVTERGERLSFLNATGRFFAKFVSTIILCIGFLMVAFTDRKRGLHDMIAGTLVVTAR